MRFLYCPNCGKMTGHKRVIGVGTIIGGVFTAGASLNAIPFYPKRCIVCGMKSKSSDADFKPQYSESYQTSEVEIENDSKSQKMDTKKCPVCAEIIKLEAIKCRFCGEKFDPTEVARQNADSDSWENRILCSDEACTGTIGPEGKCRYCGRLYEAPKS